MKTRRAALVQHLQKIACGGQISEAVFTDGFATAALGEDHLLMVIAPALPGLEPLPHPVGLADLPTVIKSFAIAAGEGNEGVDVSLRVEDDRLIIEEEAADLYLMTAAPKTIGTRVEESTVEKVQAKAPAKGSGVPLSRKFIDEISKAFSSFKVAEVEVEVGPKGGQVRVGNDHSHYAVFPSKDLKSKESYTLLFDKHFVDVLSQITDYSEAALYLGGPDTLVRIQDGPYAYFLSPKQRSADDKGKKDTALSVVKGKPKSAAKAVSEAAESE